MRRQPAVVPENCSPSPISAPEKTSYRRNFTFTRSPVTATAPVISAWALIAFQSAYCTGLAKLVTRAICASCGMARNRPVPVRSSATTWVICAASSAEPLVSASNTGAAKGSGSITPSVISMRSGPSCAAAGVAKGTARGRDKHSAAAKSASGRVTEWVRTLVI